MPSVSLYIHVPFCRRRCPYCDFYSTTELSLREAYTGAVVRWLRAAPLEAGTRVPTVYFGGGTPYLLGEGLLTVLEEISRRFSLEPGAEITLEANPGDLELPLLRRLREGGFGRISLGIQAGDDRGLRLLGRRHTARQSREGVELCRLAGFGNISLDMMLATPGQGPEEADALAGYLLSLEPEHISAYLLKVEPGTPFAREHMEERCPGPDEAAESYLAVCRRLREAGYRHYEISNFALPGFESRHNTVYWKLGEYLGVGPSAASFLGGRRFRIPGDLGAFLAAPEPWQGLEEEGPGGGLLETVMLSLRLADGLDTRRLPSLGGDPAAFLLRAAPLERAGYLTCRDGVLSLTDRGFLVSNSVIGALMGEE